jgi:hypothetical protein
MLTNLCLQITLASTDHQWFSLSDESDPQSVELIILESEVISNLINTFQKFGI